MADSSSTDRDNRQVNRFIGLAVYGSALAGIGGVLLALLGVMTGRWEAAGAGLIAAAVAFGALANALLRK